jgi:hypothetical protein
VTPLNGNPTVAKTSAGVHIGCFGHFRFEDLVCRKHCALRIRCAIEKNQKIYLEVMEEMEAGDDVFLKFQ